MSDIDLDAIAAELVNPTPSWRREKPCAMCRAPFIPADPRQELCPEHHRDLVRSLRTPFKDPLT